MMGGLMFYSPNINIFRDPRWGRGQETYGEDSFLAARLGVAFIIGMQGDDLDHLVVTATAKHYAVHSGPEPLRHGFDAKASAHDIEDAYLPAFRAAVVEGRVKSVMCGTTRSTAWPAAPASSCWTAPCGSSGSSTATSRATARPSGTSRRAPSTRGRPPRPGPSRSRPA
jgi:beta-glucosidase-like glycosyl hydrolase